MTASIKWISCLAVASAMALTSFASAAAEPTDGVRTRTVKAWDLDLAKPEDVQTLYGRVREAARDVCRTEAREHWKSTRTAAPLQWTQSCVRDAVDTAVREIDNPLLATLHATTTRGSASLR
jgi:UrcA family protein